MKTLAIATVLATFPLSIAPDANIPKADLQYKEDGSVAKRKLPIKYAFGYGFPEDSKMDVWLGFEYWNSVAGVQVFDLVNPDNLGTNEPVVRLEALPSVATEDADWAITRVTSDVNSTVAFLAPIFTHAEMHAVIQSVARHEAGHVVLFKHSMFPQCLMYEEIQASAAMKEPKRLCMGELKQLMDVYGK